VWGWYNQRARPNVPGQWLFDPAARWSRTTFAGPPVQTMTQSGRKAGYIAVPVARPIPIPAIQTLPEASSKGEPRADDFTRTLSPSIVLTWTTAQPGTPARPVTVTVPRVVPNARTQEKKLKMSKGVGSIVHLFNEFTEVEDLIRALYKGLAKDSPCAKKVRAKALSDYVQKGGSRQPSVAAQAWALANCSKDIDWNVAIFEALWANVEDRVWAMLGLPTKEAGLPYGANAPVNVALGKVLGHQVSGGTKAVHELVATTLRDKFGIDVVAKSPPKSPKAAKKRPKPRTERI